MKYLSVVLVLFCSLVSFSKTSTGEETDKYTYGIESYQNGEYQKAVDFLEQASKENPDNDVILYNLGVAYFSLGDYFSATEMFNTALLLNVEFPEVYYALGSLYLKSENRDLAKMNYKKACDFGLNKGCVVYQNL
ncbi:MAG: tetratricopeptide repeat protein [Nitrospinota bacterium]